MLARRVADNTVNEGGLGIFPIAPVTLLGDGWSTARPHLLPLALGTFVLFSVGMMCIMPFSVGQVVTQMVAESLEDQGLKALLMAVALLLQALGSLANAAFQGYTTIGGARAARKLVLHGDVGVSDFIVTDVRVVASATVASLLSSLAAMAGMCLFIVPGLVIAGSLMLWPMVLLHEQVGPIAALQRSWALTEGSRAEMVVWTIAAFFCVMLATIFTFGLGLFVAVPIIQIGLARAYFGLRRAEQDRRG